MKPAPAGTPVTNAGPSSGGTATAAKPLNYDGEAVVVEQSERVLRYNPDGTGEQNVHVRARIQNESGAHALSVLSFPYAAANGSAQLQSLSVRHTDGTSTETPATDAMDMPAPVTQQAPLYSDLKVLQVPVRGLRTGDVLEYRLHIQMKNAESPDLFWGTHSFTKDNVVLAESLTLDLPQGKYVQVWSPTVKSTLTESGGRRVYVWTHSQLKPTSSKKADDDEVPETPPDNKPDIAWTTFHNWQEVGEWYRALASPRAVATDALRAQADEITRDAKTPEAQVRAIYTFVSTRIRYVGVDFGIGRFQPHLAAEVLANQYGDCKDKDTLLEALLHAKGFTTAPALIGANIDMVPELPSMALFNHVITTVTLPAGGGAVSRIWLDATPEVGPFEFLLGPLRDKQALVIPATGIAALEKTPARPPYPFEDHFEAVATLKANGDLTGHVEISYRSDNEFVMRTIARSIAPAQWDKGSQYFANAMGFSGTTSNTTFARAEDLSVPMHLSYDYAKKPFGDWDSFRIIPLFPVLILPPAPEKKPAVEIDLGPVRTESAISRIKLPDGFGSDLPNAVHVAAPFARLDKTYSLKDGVLVAEKTLVVLQSKLPADQWEKYKAFTKDISLTDGESWIQLTSSAKAGDAKTPHPPQPGENNPVAQQLITDSGDFQRSRDWNGALAKLDAAKAIAPEQPYLWANYGYVAMMQNKADEGKKFYRHELEHHPDESFVASQYAWFLISQKQDDEARTVLSAYFKTDPSVENIALQLANLQSLTSLPDAIATLRTASAAVPNSHVIRGRLGELLHRNHQDTEAAAIAKEELAEATTPVDLNAGAYVLAETKTDLPLAEDKARQALEKLGTVGTEIEESNSQSVQQGMLQVATWDTLGFILFQENHLDEARDYLEAAWMNNPDMTVGLHLGQVQEAMGDAHGALRTYILASAVRASNPPDQKVLNENIARLKLAWPEWSMDAPSKYSPEVSRHGGALVPAGGSATQILQEERTFRLRVKSPGESYRSAVFRLQLAADSTQAVVRVSGDASLEEEAESIKKLRLSHLVPTHSTAHILREGVVSCSPGRTECEFVLAPMGAFLNAPGN
ncbi:MAG TPA: DUF3857 domain-containing protein [Acidisarcina sp.]